MTPLFLISDGGQGLRDDNIAYQREHKVKVCLFQRSQAALHQVERGKI
jgi:hypothetical protein